MLQRLESIFQGTDLAYKPFILKISRFIIFLIFLIFFLWSTFAFDGKVHDDSNTCTGSLPFLLAVSSVVVDIVVSSTCLVLFSKKLWTV